MMSMAGTISGGASYSNNGNAPQGLGSEQIEDDTEKDNEKKLASILNEQKDSHFQKIVI